MINHARTLLMNVRAGRKGVPGEAYIPSAYVPKTLSGSVAAIRRILFGATPDIVMLNARTRQLLSVLHSCELVEHVLALDPRITYDVRESSIFSSQFGLQVSGTSGQELRVTGQLDAPDATGIAENQWIVQVENESRAVITRTTNPAVQIAVDLTVTDGLSQLIPLPYSSLSCQFPVTTANFWSIYGIALPSTDVAGLTTKLHNLGDPVLAPLFGVTTGKSTTEPYKTFYELWQNHPELLYRLGALILALIYQTNEL